MAGCFHLGSVIIMESSGGLLSAASNGSAPTRESFRFNRRQSIVLVSFCTVFGAAAQILIKSGANTLPSTSFSAIFTNLPLLAETLTAMVTSLPILTGYGLYAIVTALLVLALRDGELSILYPVISLTYVWVTFLSLAFLGESLNLYKILGICIIVAGVGVLGKDGKK
jgi:uncharacterized membrane protein